MGEEGCQQVPVSLKTGERGPGTLRMSHGRATYWFILTLLRELHLRVQAKSMEESSRHLLWMHSWSWLVVRIFILILLQSWRF